VIAKPFDIDDLLARVGRAATEEDSAA